MAALLASRPVLAGVQLRTNRQAVPRVATPLRAFSGAPRLPGQVHSHPWLLDVRPPTLDLALIACS